MKRLLSLLICLVMLGSMFPFTIFAGADGEAHALRFLCDGAAATVTVYDLTGVPVPVRDDGIHHLTPGTYFYTSVLHQTVSTEGYLHQEMS